MNAETTSDESVVAAARSRRRPAVAALAALTVALIGTGVGLLVTSGSPAPADRDLAVVDTRATAQVVGQVETGLRRVLTYSYAHPASTRAAARRSLVGAAAAQYDVLFAALVKKAGDQQLTLRATVVDAGVTSLIGDRAQLLVFVDQSSTRASDGRTATSAAQLQISAVRSGGVWRISRLVPL